MKHESTVPESNFGALVDVVDLNEGIVKAFLSLMFFLDSLMRLKKLIQNLKHIQKSNDMVEVKQTNSSPNFENLLFFRNLYWENKCPGLHWPLWV